MTRAPRVKIKLRDLRSRVPAGLPRRAAVYAGAGLVLAGVGVVTGLTGTPAAAAPRAAAESAAAQPAVLNHIIAPAGHPITPPAVRPATRPTAPAKRAVSVKHAGPAKAGSKRTSAHPSTWAAVRRIVAARTYPKPTGHGTLPARDQLTPSGTSGPQSRLPMTPGRYQNAKAIVRVALNRHMGVRSAVIAVATAMQESGLLNLHYGTSDSLGLFQQRPSCGWGTAAQIMHPSYAAREFLSALRSYQHRTPGWARAPLWQDAQGVQASAYPYAYAKWEAQASSVVSSVTRGLV